MPVDFLPKREADLRDWSANFRLRINESPETFGLTAAQAAEYAAVQETFATAYRLANQPSTRTPSGVGAKNDAKRALQKLTRQLAGIVRATPSVNAVERKTLGLSVADPGGYRPPVPVPSHAPGLRVVAWVGRTVRVRVYDVVSLGRRGKPRGCDGVTFFSHVGDVPPCDLSNWRHAGQTAKTTYEIRFGPHIEPFTKVWLCARWFNPRGQHGPMSTWVSTHIQPGVAKAA